MTLRLPLPTDTAEPLRRRRVSVGPCHPPVDQGRDFVLDLRPHWWYLAPAGALLAVVTLVALALRASWWGPLDWAILLLFLGALSFFGFTYLQWTTTSVVTNELLVSRKV